MDMIVMILSFLRRAPCSRRSFTFVAIALQSVVSRLSHRYHILLLWKGTTSIYPVVVNVLMFNMPVNGLAINALNGCQDAMVCDALLHQTGLGLRLPCGFFVTQLIVLGKVQLRLLIDQQTITCAWVTNSLYRYSFPLTMPFGSFCAAIRLIF